MRFTLDWKIQFNAIFTYYAKTITMTTSSATKGLITLSLLFLTMGCSSEPISVKSRADYDIPADALASCGGWWAGGGDYFYAIWENNNVVVYQGWQDEGQKDNGFHWKAVKR